MGKSEILDVLRKYKAKNSEKYGITRLGVFGSVARDETHPGSDIDIVIGMKKPDLFYMVHIKEDLEKECHQKVDIIHYRDTMNPFLKKRIDRDAVYA